MKAFPAALLFSTLTTCGLCRPTAPNSTLPVVDLGYELHQAISFNATGDYYTWSNIRYARPPVGDLRFRAPLPPTTDRSEIQNGSAPRFCPQGIPFWLANENELIGEYVGGRPFTTAAWEADLAAADNVTSSAPDLNVGTTEDCLFLDVYAPQKVFEQGQAQQESRGVAPVLVWIHGGGAVLGSKTGAGSTNQYNPVNLIADSKIGGSEGMVFVALSYRLGAFGWLAGPTLQADGTQNAGLYDQRLALEWVQQYIHLFGGDKDRVTLMGESAGGSSVMLQITAFGGLKGPAPFAQAIAQSPGYIVLPGSIQTEDISEKFLRLLNVSTIDEARTLTSEAIIAANAQQVFESNFSTFTYGPVVDGSFMPAQAGQLLRDGAFDHSVKVMTGHNAAEGLIFGDPKVNTSDSFSAWLEGVYPNIAAIAADYIENTLYPPVFDGSFGYSDQFERTAAILAEQIFTCNDYFLNRAFGNQTYAYEFSVVPALHTADLSYTFATPGAPSLNSTVATALQQYISSFTVNGVPTAGGGAPIFPTYGSGMQQVNLTDNGIYVSKDDTFVERCLW